MTATPDYLPMLGKGAHPDPHDGACFMEFASFLAGEVWSDRPACANFVLSELSRYVNDAVNPADRQLLLPLVPRVIGTADYDHDQTVFSGLVAWIDARHLQLHDPCRDPNCDMAYDGSPGINWMCLSDRTVGYAAEITNREKVTMLVDLYDTFDRLAARNPDPVTTEQYTAFHEYTH